MPKAAPRALFLHGAGAWGGQWAVWRRMFEAADWLVETPDLRPAADGLAVTRLGDYVEQATVLLDAEPVDVVIGASLGGLIAVAASAQVAVAHRPRALVLVNPLPPAPWAHALPPVVAEGDVVPWRSQGRFASTHRALREVAFVDQQFAFRHWRDESARVLRDAQVGMTLPASGVVTLIVASEADDTIPPALSAAYAQGIGASLCRVPGGHIAPVMGASAVAAAQASLAWLAPHLSVP